MDAADFFANLPRGKEDIPLLFTFGPLSYDFHEIDGLYAMLDKDFSGCVMLTFAKPMNDTIRGRVTLDGKEVAHHYLKFMPIMNNLWVLAVRVRGMIREYGKEYILHVEGFVDEDGNEMNPQDFTVTAPERVRPQEKDAAHEAVALQAAEEGIVLLENKNRVLPLKSGQTLNVFGKAMHQFRIGAVGAGKINPRYSVDFLTAVKDCEEFTLNEELVDFYGCDEDLTPDKEMLERAKKQSDTAIFILTRGSGENLDNSSAKGEYYLTELEEHLIQTLSETFKRVIGILDVAYPMDVTFAEKYKVDGLIYCGLGGMLAGEALVNVMSGKTNPSGKLPDTWAKDYFDIPSSVNFYDCVDKPRLDAEQEVYVDTCYEEDIYVGYRYFKTFNKAVAYPFGYGLSYTSFAVAADSVNFSASDGLTLHSKVINSGKRAGKEVVQIYVQQPRNGLEKPERILVGFEKTKELKPGESQEICFEIPAKHLTVYSESKAAYVMEAGEYVVYAGNDVNACKCGSFTLPAALTVKQVSNLMQPGREIQCLSYKKPQQTWPQGKMSGVKDGISAFEPRVARKSYEAKFKGIVPDKKLSYRDIKESPELTEDFVAQMSVEELARVTVCGSAGWGMEGIGEAGHIVQIDGYEMPPFLVSDGNSGVNLNARNIGMPSGATICASFNKELAADIGRVIGEEAKALDMPMILAPALNIHRNPLNGRQPEYFSEDPYLAGMMAGNYAKGMEGAGVATSMKHVLANNCESSRKRNMSIMTERALREIYFRAFEIAMEVHMPASIMTAYNACNGCPTAADPELLQGLLREECGFDGFVMTDWTSYDTVDVVEMVNAGNCWLTPGSLDDTFTAPIVKAVEDGRIPMKRLQENVAWILKTMVRFV